MKTELSTELSKAMTELRESVIKESERSAELNLGKLKEDLESKLKLNQDMNWLQDSKTSFKNQPDETPRLMAMINEKLDLVICEDTSWHRDLCNS